MPQSIMLDKSKDAVNVITKNAEKTRLTDKCKIYCTDSFDYLKRNKGEKFDLIFIDPPYAANLWESVLDAIYRFDILSNHGIIICESPLDKELPQMEAPYFLHRTYRYGKIKVTTYHREEGRQA